jgi:phenylacetate-CoA ligase
MGRFDKLYGWLPTWAQHAAVSTYGLYWRRLRFGPGYERLVADYAEREQWPAERLDEWIAERLRTLLQLAATHVPYYRRTWSPSQKSAAAEGRLAELPLLEKDPLRADPTEFLREDLRPWHAPVFHTSGSTGTPIKTIWTVKEYRDALALREVRSARWAGVSFRQPRATFSGRMVEPDPHALGPFHRFNLAERQVYFSAFHLRPDTAVTYVDALRRHGVVWLTGYAVSYYLLAKFMLQQGLEPPPLRAVITTSEKVTPGMRTVMEQAYRCRVFEEYSTVENALFASECSHGRLHVSSDAGIVEILRPDGTPCEPEEEGEVVATCLTRTYQPLVRFRLGDVAAWSAEPCSCGRTLPVLKEVLGRVEDVVIGPDGRQMVRFHGIFSDQPHISEGQIVQEAYDRIRVKVVPSTGYGAEDTAEIVRRVQQRLGPEVHVEVQCVESIPRSKAGKFQAVVSRLGEQGLRQPERTGVG